ncbi:ABC transporter permease [Terrabacter tumescens]|uniref:ABC transporter permease n=1 Tax=Terrabacter tumescens TaxID=60443 RepID=A0ABQ2I6H6_9MICO|nr:ABC transporter permease [Terrabacter tumescens]GGN00224.1 ABC transporter permease [Terrabacter tumescens]
MTTTDQRPTDRERGPVAETALADTTDTAAGGRAWAVVAAREIVVRLTNRAFLVSTLITLVFIAGFGAFSVWEGSRTTTYTVAVAGSDGRALVERAAVSARQDDDKVSVVATSVSGEPAARTLVDEGSADAWLHETGTGWTLTSADDADLALRTAVESALRSTALERNAAAAGTTVQALEQGTTLTTTRFDGQVGNSGFVKGATFAFALLFFMAAMMFGQQISASVVEEKQSRLVEILATAIPLRQLLAGKILGNSVIALGQVVLFAAVGLVAVSFTDLSTLLPSLSTAVVWFVLFFAVGFFALACLYAVAGALASRTEDLQSTTAPMTTILMAVYVASFGLSGKALEVASFVPIASVVSMPGRLLAGDAAWWEPVVALLLMAGFSAVTVVVGERIYRRSLMQSGGRVSWKQALTAQD